MNALPRTLFCTPISAGLLAGALACIMDFAILRTHAIAVAREQDAVGFVIFTGPPFVKTVLLLSAPFICFRTFRPAKSTWIILLVASFFLWIGSMITNIAFHPFNFDRGMSPNDRRHVYLLFIALSLFHACFAAGIGALTVKLYDGGRKLILRAALFNVGAAQILLLRDVVILNFGNISTDVAAAGLMIGFFGNLIVAVAPAAALPADHHQRLGWSVSARITSVMRRVSLTDTPATRFELGELLFENAEFANALKEFNHLLKLDPESCEALYFAAKCNQKMNEHVLALDYYEKMINHKDGRRLRFGKAWLDYTHCLESVGQIQMALEECRKLAREYPRPLTEFAYAKILLKSGDAIESRRILDDMLGSASIAPEEDRVWIAEGRALRARI